MADRTGPSKAPVRYRVIIRQLPPADHPTQEPQTLMDHEVSGPMNLVAVLASLADHVILSETEE